MLLHVVWDEPKFPAGESAPLVLPLKTVLDAPLAELGLSLENEPLRSLPEYLRGKCSASPRELPESRVAELLQAAAETRFRSKAAAMLARAKSSGWEQALWENLFRALGYKHNVWPMLHLAETKPRWSRGAYGTGAGDTAFEIQARLLGISGLLPGDLTRAQKSSDTFLRRAWDCWWRERDKLESCVLPRAEWKFHGLRPANHPQHRLALASHWLADQKFISKIESWATAEISGGGTALFCVAGVRGQFRLETGAAAVAGNRKNRHFADGCSAAGTDANRPGLLRTLERGLRGLPVSRAGARRKCAGGYLTSSLENASLSPLGCGSLATGTLALGGAVSAGASSSSSSFMASSGSP
jgi:hypothetical protein